MSTTMTDESTGTITLKKNIKTPQQAFDAVVRHLAKQKRKAWEGACVYYSHDTGERCAVGALVPIAEAKRLERDFAGSTVRQIVGSQTVRTSPISTNLLEDLQSAHDLSMSCGDLKRRLLDLAARYALDGGRVYTIEEWDPVETPWIIDPVDY
jgi:hypothetical protein